MVNDEHSERDQRGELRVLDLCTKESWWNVRHLVKLNLMLAVPFMSAYIGEYDDSVLNGMQTLEHWKISNVIDPEVGQTRKSVRIYDSLP